MCKGLCFRYIRDVQQAIEQQIIALLETDPASAIPLIYDHYADSLYGVVLNIVGREEEAQDVLQRSMVKYWKHASSFDPKKARLFTWLLNIARNAAIDVYRSRGRKQDKEIRMDVSDVYTVQGDPINPDVMDIRKQVEGLEVKYQVVLEALYFRGMTQQEASEALDLPIGTVKTRLRIALRELRSIFDVDTLGLLMLLNLLK